ncbi:L,D-transpeptidase family protein [Rhodopirellula sp. MGV]|uniref:L,D-transpeptidase family protein n=1 Tax=Rhodopirellula sp. MGV TaxID=2023130 RepID=UPI000B964396|nr:L,D-transpeptidase family protein [Rhodopirellula sp. MGV]OYP34013.1 hypothetical protein CGZ80_16490 [Rhodopirellula sp. MGV]PNY38360.1 L,D-transpeptidase [Rhodopirellula baltica]
MQTIKTAAIVVLMLTVLYGGYVSMTTPPEPSPADLEGILVIDESGTGSFGPEPLMPDSLMHDLAMQESTGSRADHSLGLSQPPAGLLDESPTDSHASSHHSHGQPANQFDATATDLLTPPTSPQSQASKTSAESPGMSFADLNPATGLPSDDAPNNDMPRALPSVNSTKTAVTPGPIDSYASTPNEFELPDPTNAASDFGSSSFSDPGMTLESGANASQNNLGLKNAIAAADKLYQQGNLKEALSTLSLFYGMPDISEAQRAELMSRLDPLAREVIYSQRHLLEQPYKVNGSESLRDIADAYQVPWQLLSKINNVSNPITVLPGTELKIVRGPFRAEVDLTGKVMTMFLGDLYAGRFNIEVGKDPVPTPGTFTVQDKQTSRTFYGPNGATIAAGQPENPYGKLWLDLGGQLCIHGSPNTVKPTSTGCISVAGDYSEDVFGILSQGSTVTIKR